MCSEMFEGDEASSPFTRTINAISEMMLNKIITLDKDLHVSVSISFLL